MGFGALHPPDTAVIAFAIATIDFHVCGHVWKRSMKLDCPGAWATTISLQARVTFSFPVPHLDDPSDVLV